MPEPPNCIHCDLPKGNHFGNLRQCLKGSTTYSSGREPGFFQVRRTVVQGEQLVCTAESATMARRIANALNLYKPDRKGK